MPFDPNPDDLTDPYAGKADFSRIYDEPDPRAYYATLGALDYEIPSHGQPLFRHLVDTVNASLDSAPTVLDVCCSYGINAALLNHHVALDDLYDHYGHPEVQPLDRAQLLDLDRAFFASRRRPDAVDVVGLDTAGNAIRYGVDAGLLSGGVVANLEEHAPSPEDAALLGAVDLVAVTGGIGYVNENTFRRIVEAGDDHPPWVAALSLRWIDFEPIAETLEDHGLVAEHVDSFAVPQRRFASAEERDTVLSELDRRGVEGHRVEADEGRHYAELYLVRPPEAVRDHPVADLLDPLVTAGA